MTIEKLDLLFKYFYECRSKQDKSLLFDNIKNDFNCIVNDEISTKELLIILYKLIDDGYVTKKVSKSVTKSELTGKVIDNKNVPLFYISFNGILLMESLPDEFSLKPYQYLQAVEKKKKKRDLIENIPKRYWWVVDSVKIILPFLLGYFIRAASEVKSLEQPTKTVEEKNTPSKIYDSSTVKMFTNK